MPEDTIRDRIWDTTLLMTYKKDEAVSPDDIAEMLSASRKTIANTLLIMSEKKWLIRETMPDGSVRYRANPSYRFEVLD